MTDIQNLNVRVPRETMLKVRDLKKQEQSTCSDVVISAIDAAHKALQQNKKTITTKINTKL